MFLYHRLSLHPFPRPQSTEIAIDISQAKLVLFHNYGSVAAPCSPSQSPLLWQLLRLHHALSAFAGDSAVHLVSILFLARMPVDVSEATSVSRSSYLDSIFAIALQTPASPFSSFSRHLFSLFYQVHSDLAQALDSNSNPHQAFAPKDFLSECLYPFHHSKGSHRSSPRTGVIHL